MTLSLVQLRYVHVQWPLTALRCATRTAEVGNVTRAIAGRSFKLEIR